MIKGQKEICEGIVLGSTQYQDDSAIVSFASQEGLLSFLAKGVYKNKSSLKALLISGNHLKIEFTKHQDGPLIASSVCLLGDASLVYTDYKMSIFMMLLNELSVSLFRYGDSYPYLDVSAIIKSLQEGGDSLSLSLLFLGSLYKSLGLKMNCQTCVICGKKENLVSYSLKDGGFICKDCLSKTDLKAKDKMDLYVLRFAFMDISPDILLKSAPKNSGIRVLNELLENLVDYFDLKPIRTYPLFLKSVSDN
ncbi:MAG: DNA repair protein RecO [Bacilli bacterium]